MTNLRLKTDSILEPLPQQQLGKFKKQIKELSLKVDLQNHEDTLELHNLLNHYFNYPDSQDAEIHREANRLGMLDLKKTAQKSNQHINHSYVRSKSKICNCCGFFVQDEQLKLCNVDLSEANYIGASTLVFFKTFFNVAFLLIPLLLIYSIFTFATNVSQGNRVLNSENNNLYYLIISLASKSKIHNVEDRAATFYLISSILSLPVIVIWFIMFIFMKKQIKKIQNQERSYSNVSDFSVLIQNIPTGFTKEQIQKALDEYYMHLESKDKDVKLFKVQKYNEARPFFLNEEEFQDEELEKIIEQIQESKKQFVSWIYQRQQEEEFFTTKPYRMQRYEKYAVLRQRLDEKYNKIRQNIRKKLQQRHKQAKTYSFITFQTIEQRDLFLSLNKKDFFSIIRNYLPCSQNLNRFIIKKNDIQYNHLYIQQAPQPQDIIWSNAGLTNSQSFSRKLLTFTLTIIMIGISFAIVYGLSRVERQNNQNRYISILISLVIGIINLIIIKIIQFTTVIERIYTNNHYQISIAIKSVFAQLFNSILVPLIVNFNIKENIFQKGGLSEDIFILAIFNSLLPPFVRLIDPYGIFVYLRYTYYQRPINKVKLNISELNNYAEKPEFQLGYEYIYLISNFLFICYYVSLQPVIPLFGFAGLLLMYWITKYSLYGRSQRPIPGNDTIGFAMYQMLFFGPIAFALGQLTWSRFVSEENFKTAPILILNLISAGIGLIAFIFPYDIFINYKQNILKKTYNERRIYFTSEYDRLNPVTYKEGIEEYKQFLQCKKRQIQNLPMAEQEEFLEGLLTVAKNNVYKGNNVNKLFYQGKTDNIINLLLQNQSKNTVDPKMLASYLLPNILSQGFIGLLQKKKHRNLQQFELKSNPNFINQVPRSHSQINHTNRNKENFRNLLSYGLKQPFKIENDINNVYSSNLKFNQLGLTSKIFREADKKKF